MIRRTQLRLEHICLVRRIKDLQKVLTFWQDKTLVSECSGQGSASHPLSSLFWKFGLAVSSLTFSCPFSSDSCCRAQFKGYSLVTLSKGQKPSVYCHCLLCFWTFPSQSQLFSKSVLVHLHDVWWFGQCLSLPLDWRSITARFMVALLTTAHPEGSIELSFSKHNE